MIRDKDIFVSNLQKLAGKYSFSLVVLFGSQASGRTHPQSDLDLAILPETQMSTEREYKIAQEISSFSGFKDVDVVNLKNASPSLLKNIIKNGKVLYEKQPGIFSLERMRAFKLFVEARPLRILRDRRIIDFLGKHLTWSTNP